MVVRGYCSRSAKTENTFKLENYNLKPHHYDHKLNQWCEPTGKKKSTIRELACSEILNVLVNDHKLSKGAKRGVSTVAKQSLLALTGHGSVSTSAIKHATALLKVSPEDHIRSYHALVPYFQQWKNLNPKLCYDIEPKNGGVFSRLTVVMPYLTEFLPNMLNVFGLDAGFMPELPVKGTYYLQIVTWYYFNLTYYLYCCAGISPELLEELLGENHQVLSDRRYVLSRLTLTVFTGLTLEHSRVLLGYCLGYGENHEDTRFFLQYIARATSSIQFNVTYLHTTDKGKTNDVNLRDKLCSCEQWQQEGYPCVHAWSAIGSLAPTGNYFSVL